MASTGSSSSEMECDGRYNHIMSMPSSCRVASNKEQCHMTPNTNDMQSKHDYDQKECQPLLREASILPLPSPPTQTGDAVFVRRPTDLDTCLPSFNHLKTPSRSCSSASSSPTPNEFTSDVGSSGYAMDINEMHPNTLSAPIPSLSPTSSTTSSSTDCNSNSYCLIPSGCSALKTQHINVKEASKFPREITPPLTPPTPLISQQHHHTSQNATNTIDEFMIEESNGCGGYLPSSFNISELPSQYENQYENTGVSYHENISYHGNIQTSIQSLQQQYRSMQQSQQQGHHQHSQHPQVLYSQTQQHSILQHQQQQQEWFGSQQQQNFTNNTSNNLQHNSNTMLTQNYGNSTSYGGNFSCNGNTADVNSRGHSNCNNSLAIASSSNTDVHYQTATYPNSTNTYIPHPHQQHSQQQHSNLQQIHQLQLQSTNPSSQVGHNINGSLAGASTICQQQQRPEQHQNNYSQQSTRHQTQERNSSPNNPSYPIDGSVTPRSSSNNIIQTVVSSSHHVNDSYCQNNFVVV